MAELRDLIADAFDEFLHQEGARQRPHDFADELLIALGCGGYVVVPHDDDQHIVELRESGWTIQHPLACRPDLFACPVNRAAERDLAEPPGVLGRFEVTVNDLDDRLLIGDRIDVDEASCRVCGCTESAACPGGCRWATDEEQIAAGLEPMEGDLCSACLPGGGGRG